MVPLIISDPANIVCLTGLDWVAALQDRLLDFDDKVRMTVVKAVCDLAKTNPKWVPGEVLRKIADRLRDKKVRFIVSDLLINVLWLSAIQCRTCLKSVAYSTWYQT